SRRSVGTRHGRRAATPCGRRTSGRRRPRSAADPPLWVDGGRSGSGRPSPRGCRGQTRAERELERDERPALDVVEVGERVEDATLDPPEQPDAGEPEGDGREAGRGPPRRRRYELAEQPAQER